MHLDSAGWSDGGEGVVEEIAQDPFERVGVAAHGGVVVGAQRDGRVGRAGLGVFDERADDRDEVDRCSSWACFEAGLGVSSTVLQAAQKGCQHLLPNSGQSSQAWDQMALTALWNFARCVRARGVPDWPDPLAESDQGQPGTPGFPRNLPPGINTNSPVVKNAMNKCQHLLAGIGYGSGGYP